MSQNSSGKKRIWIDKHIYQEAMKFKKEGQTKEDTRIINNLIKAGIKFKKSPAQHKRRTI